MPCRYSQRRPTPNRSVSCNCLQSLGLGRSKASLFELLAYDPRPCSVMDGVLERNGGGPQEILAPGTSYGALDLDSGAEDQIRLALD